MITLSALTSVTDGLPEIGTKCLVYSTQGGYAVAVFTDRIGTVGRYKEAWFCKSGRQMSKKTVVSWVGLGM
jgi:hypothetical protein